MEALALALALALVVMVVVGPRVAVLGHQLALRADRRRHSHALGAAQSTPSLPEAGPTLREVHQERLRQWQAEFDSHAYPGVACICGLKYTTEHGRRIPVPRLCAVRGHSRKGNGSWQARVAATWEALNYAGPGKPVGLPQQALIVARFEVTPSAFPPTRSPTS